MGHEKPTMTINELLNIKRQHSIRCSYGVEVANIIKGTFSYGICLKEDGRRVYLISKAKFYRWMTDEFGIQIAQPVAS